MSGQGLDHDSGQEHRAVIMKSKFSRSPGPLSVNTSFSSQPYHDSVSSLADSDSTSIKYRNDYSRSQHPPLPTSTKAPLFNTENMSPEQIRFEKYVNRFAAHDPRSSPVRRSSSKQSMSERISRFNAPPPSGVARFTYPDPEPQMSESVASSEAQPVTPSKAREPSGLKPFLSREVESTQLNQIGGSSSTITTATNTSSEGRKSPESPQRRHLTTVTMTPGRYGTKTALPSIATTRVPPSSLRASPLSSSHRSYSYDQPSPASRQTIDMPSPNKVRELRSKLWDTNETLKVAVQPSLHYVGRGRGAARTPTDAPDESPAADTSGEQPVRERPEMAGRSGHRTTRSLSPHRPQYKSAQFKSRFYEAALASRRQAQQEKLPEQRTQDRIERERLQQERIEQEHREELALKRDEALKEEDLRRQQEEMLVMSRIHQEELTLKREEALKEEDLRRQQEEMLVMSRIQQEAESMKQKTHQQQQSQQPTAERSMWRPEPNIGEERSEGRSSGRSEGRSNGTDEPSVSKLVAKLNSISRDDPAAALAQIDSILRAESKSSSDHDTRFGNILIHEEKKMQDNGDDEDEDSESDDETSVSSITNPSYANSPKNGIEMSMSGNRRPRPNALQNYHQAGAEDTKTRMSKKDKKNIPPPMENIKVKEPVSRGKKENRLGALDLHVEKAEEDAVAASRASPAEIAMKIRLWDELSNSDSKSSRKREDTSVVQEEGELISANTEDLGSIVTPADTAAGSSPGSPPKAVAAPKGSVPIEQTRYISPARSRERQIQALLDIADSVGSDSLGRGLERSQSPTSPPREGVFPQPLTPRRHPWDHHHPRNKPPVVPSQTKFVDTSMEDGEGVELKPAVPPALAPPKPQPATLAPPKPQQRVLHIKKEAMAKTDMAAGGGTPRTSPRSSPQNQTLQQGVQSSFTGDTFEVDPSLLKSNDEFGMPLRVKNETPSQSPFLDDFDSAWQPLPSSAFSNSKTTTRSGSRPRTPQAVQTSGSIGSNAPPKQYSPSNLPQSYGDEEPPPESKSPGRRRFNLRKLKKNQDSIVQLNDRAPTNSYSMDTILQTQRSKSQSPGRRRASPSRRASPGRLRTSPGRMRERSGSLSNLVQKFRIRRTGTKDSLTDDMD